LFSKNVRFKLFFLSKGDAEGEPTATS